MSCIKYKKLITVSVFGELTAVEEQQLKQHIQNCQACAQVASKSDPFSGKIDKNNNTPLPDWEKSWQVISNRALPKIESRHRLYPHKKWALAASILVAVFILGFFAGKKFFFQPSGSGFNNSLLLPQRASLLQSYAENLEPVLIEFMNRPRLHQPEEFSRLEETMIKDMLIQTRLLKHVANKKNISHLQVLLEDLEFILIGISNLNPKDKQSADYLTNIIKEKGIRFKLKALLTPEKSI